MRLQLFSSGLVDDLLFECADVVVERIGLALYRLEVRNAAEHAIVELWTTRKGAVNFDVLSVEAPPEWVTYNRGEGGTLQRPVANRCAVHLEHLDRGAYFLGVARGQDGIGMHLRTRGYIKSRVVTEGEFDL